MTESSTPPIINCPGCRYLLRGLPDRGRCPECGFHYDPLTAEIPAPRIWRTLYVMPALPAIFGIVTMRQNTPAAILFIIFGIGLFALLWMFRPRFVLAEKGICLVWTKAFRWVPWHDIDTITVDGWFGLLKITNKQGRRVFWVPNQDIGGRNFARRMKLIIEEKREAYAQAGPGNIKETED